MIVAHASDTHDAPSIIRSVADVECDLILLTGDIISNKGRVRRWDDSWDGMGSSWRIDKRQEVHYQESWLRKQAKKWAVAFRERPVVYVPGNHDFVGIERWLVYYGHSEVYTIGEELPYVDLLGKRFAGFREINYIAGEWEGESHALAPVVDRALSCNPDILVTHAPPAGILDAGFGVSALASALAYREHKITHHFFGHIHERGGCVEERMGIRFINGACRLRLHEVL